MTCSHAVSEPECGRKRETKNRDYEVGRVKRVELDECVK
jgi:hypothetical protein